ncbi:bifunctional tryptophan synthase trp1 [Allomyces arbusculus]|nr:bifunctional tryptophan synthase trp1 [Allomyces arbusculus]
MSVQLQLSPAEVVDHIRPALTRVRSDPTKKSVYLPVFATLSADLLTPVTAYLKVAHHADYSFLLESVQGGEKLGRYSFIGANPYEILITGDGPAYRVHGDPLIPLERELSEVEFVPVPNLPSFTGGAVGFVTFDCIQYFEPRTRRDLEDQLGLPEAVFLFCDSLVVFDHLHHVIKVVTHIKVPAADVPDAQLEAYIELKHADARARLGHLVATLTRDFVPLPPQPPIPPRHARAEPVSNVGKDGYMSFVKSLQHHIVEGDIFQAVPSQRVARPTALHPFNAYRQLRSFNPSPYMFYLHMKDFQIVGASPEMLAKVDDRKVYTHPIAGTRRRGRSAEEDDALAKDLLSDEKERAEHIMLVDLGRNDVNRICDPATVQVESLMHIEKYSHVMHIVSVVSGQLRPEQNQFTAFRSIFPAGTVSGSPKVKAIELIRDLEKTKRGIYAGAVGHFDYSGGMDTCIAIRTMVFKDGCAYLQAGGGIVYDSNQEDEYVETINKMKSSITALERAEDYYFDLQQQGSALVGPMAVTNGSGSADANAKAPAPVVKTYTNLPTLQSANAIYNLTPAKWTDVTLLIDNYDSFVFNVYQYLCQEGANVVVYRNDQVTLDEIKKLNLKNIVISPGPGHPADSGISLAVIKEFAGKLPILGVCLGEQAMFHLYGGTVTYAGSIVHGKTSTITHDGKGLYADLPQNFAVTRYHSLAGDKATLPDCLEVTSWTADGLVMGVRHKEFTVEGVQYHPESVMSQHGHAMIRNFMQMRGGKWSEQDARITRGIVPSSPDVAEAATSRALPAAEAAVSDAMDVDQAPKPNGAVSAKPKPKETILERIYRQRRLDVAAAQQRPGQSLAQLRQLVAVGAAASPVSFYDRLRNPPHAPAVMAEVKRASPSKGLIDGTANAPLQALEYARAGASVISVLTEPTWFKGDLADLQGVHNALLTQMGDQRPAVLRKDFVFDEYQILEARLAGADAVLLIVAMLTDAELRQLITITRVLGMEPLVEVNSKDEMSRALQLGARVVGINNRNLHTFDVDMATTTTVAQGVPKDVIVCALSGIWGRKDVEPYLAGGVQAVLVGEALMRSSDKRAFVRDLWGLPAVHVPASPRPLTFPLVKICGVRTVEHAVAAARAGADFVGIIQVPGTKRYVDIATTRSIVQALHPNPPTLPPVPRRADLVAAAAGATNAETDAAASPSTWARVASEALAGLLAAKRPLVVGVFQNQPLVEIARVVRETGIDVVQLHGDEPVEYATYLPVPVIKVTRVDTSKPAAVRDGPHHLALLDSAHGGSGKTFDWTVVPSLVAHGEGSPASERLPFLLAGGLNVNNVQRAIAATRPFGVDVSSGIEVDGVKSVELITQFVDRAKRSEM